jgi:hypothetical protein
MQLSDNQYPRTEKQYSSGEDNKNKGKRDKTHLIGAEHTLQQQE